MFLKIPCEMPRPKIGVRSCQRFSLQPYSPVTAFKFLHSKDLHYWERGSLKIDLMSSYAPKDGYEISEIGGKNDAFELWVALEEITIRDSSALEEQKKIQNLYNLGVANIMQGALGFRVGSGRMKRKDRFVYCISEKLNKDIFSQWHVQEGYDTVLKIHDLGKFAAAIEKADRQKKQLLTAGGHATIDWIEYCKMPLDNQELNNADFGQFTFLKDRSKYSWQNEIRISWPLQNGDTKPNAGGSSPLFLDIKNLSSYYSIVEVPRNWSTI